jgi:hypothetical protein
MLRYRHDVCAAVGRLNCNRNGFEQQLLFMAHDDLDCSPFMRGLEAFDECFTSTFTQSPESIAQLIGRAKAPRPNRRMQRWPQVICREHVATFLRHADPRPTDRVSRRSTD